MRKGHDNEDQIIKNLDKYLCKFSNGKYRVHSVRNYPLLVRRDVQICSSSPNGVCALLKRNEDGKYKFWGLCVLEIKTQSALGTVYCVYRRSMNGNRYTECSAGSSLFKQSVSDPPYRSQLGQHGTALVQLTLIVYSIPGDLPQQMVLVSFSGE